MANLRVVAETSKEAIERKRVTDALEAPLEHLAANVMRIVRGAGKPELLLRQMSDLLELAAEYKAVCGHLPRAHDIASILHASRDQDPDELEFERQFAFDVICRGALQKLAARIMDQPLQVQSGEQEMSHGIEMLERAIKERARTKKRALKLPAKD